MKKKILVKSYISLIISAFTVGILSVFLADSLKWITELVETQALVFTREWSYFLIIFPSVGITLIYFTRKYLFRGKKNKGIAEIFHTLEHRQDELPFYKVPSHYLNGFLTVIFGGSTGIEVSTVVATAALGASAKRKKGAFKAHKTALVCAGVTAGIGTLFGSPLAGLLFAIEVISKKVTRTVLIGCGISAGVTWLFLYFVKEEPLFDLSVSIWKIEALPFMIILSLMAGGCAVYFTKSVIFIKAKFAKIKNNFIRVNLGALAVGISLFFFPQLYGDSYHAFPALLEKMDSNTFSLGFAFLLIALIALKPLVASLTLGAGGDGGVFAPSIVTGAILGIFVALFCNYFFNTDLIALNFALIGGAAMLSAAIHAPLTSIFLTCSIVVGGFSLFLPVLLGSFIAKFAAKYICSYTVYTYKRKKEKISFHGF